MGQLILEFREQGGVSGLRKLETVPSKGAAVTVSQGATWHRHNQAPSVFSVLIFFFGKNS